jgi:DNA-binding transcriptional ArsR family regulator
MPIFKKPLCLLIPMARESFLLVSLKEEKAKKLAQVVSNESCRKILDYLTSKEATETELAKKLGLPISTVHYNLRHLQNAGLVTAEEFHYSKKGREVNHYKLANKYIIIAPKTTFGIKEKLKSILPVALILSAGAFAAEFFGKMRIASFGAVKSTAEAAQRAVEESAPMAAEPLAAGGAVPTAAESVATTASQPLADAVATTGGDAFMQYAPEAADAAVNAAAGAAADAAPIAADAAQSAVSYPSIALWFVIGAIAALALYLAVDYIRDRRR